MTLFRIISVLGIVSLLGAIASVLRRRLKSWRDVWRFLAVQAGDSWRVWSERRVPGPGGILASLRRSVSRLAVVLFLVLLGTGFVPVVFLGEHLSGFLLVIHVTVAPLFALSLASLALLWAHRLRFDTEDWRVARGPGKGRGAAGGSVVRCAVKTGFWLVLFLSLPLMGSIILGLFPLFGTEGEELLIRIHGYSALVLALVALTQIYLLLLSSEKSHNHVAEENTP
jgi:hypothetical protein